MVTAAGGGGTGGGGGGGGTRPGGGSGGPSISDLSAQFGILQQINQVTLQIAVSNREIRGYYDDQLEILEEIRDVLKEISEEHVENILNNFQLLSESLRSISGTTNEVSGRVRDLGTSFRDASSEQRDFTDGATAGLDDVSGSTANANENLEEMDSISSRLSKGVDELGKKFGKFMDKFRKTSNALLFFQGLGKGISNLMALSKGAFSIFKTLIGSVFKLSAAIILFPLNVLKNIIGMAGKAVGDTAYAEALQDVVKQFGALGGPTTGAIVDSAKSMDGFNKTGLNTFQVFGNMAERLRYVTQMAAETGAAFNLLMKDFEGAEGVLYAYAKGLGLANDEIKLAAENAAAMGISSEKYLRDMTKYAYGLADAFGEQGKVISKDVGKALKDMKHFATVSAKQIAQAAVYARKLGLELDRITGIMDAFDTFEDAADNASKLNQTLGIQVDTFKMMQANSPDERIAMVRKAMQEAGVSAEKMDRFQLRLLASSVGLDEQTAKTALSMKNQGMSLDEIKKKGSGLDKKTMTQEEAMSKLSTSIEKLVKQGEQMDGFWSQFKKGIGVGIQQSSEFRRMVANIRRSMIGAYYSGVQFGKAMTELFPGLKQIFTSIANMFEPGRFKKFTDSVTASLKGFVKDMSSGSASLPDLMKNLKKNFFDWFDKSSPHGMAYLDGLKKFVTGIADIASQAAKYAIESLSKGLITIADLISGKKKMPVDVTSPLGFLEGIVMKFVPAFKALGDSLWPAIQELSSALWKKISEAFMSPKLDGFRKKLMIGVFAVLFGPAMINLAIGMIAKSMMGGAAGGGAGGLLGAFMGAGGGGTLGRLLDRQREAAASANLSGRGFGSSMTDSLPDQNGVKKLEVVSSIKISWGDVIKFIVGFTGLIAVGLIAFFGALLLLKRIKATRDDIINAGIMVAAIGVMMGGLAGALDVLTRSEYLGEGSKTNIIGKLLVLGLLIGVGFYSFYKAIEIVKGHEKNDIIAAGLLLRAMPMILVPLATAAAILSILKIDFFNLIKSLAGVAMLSYLMLDIASKTVEAVKLTKATPKDAITAGLLLMSFVPVFLSMAVVIAAIGWAGKVAKDPTSIALGLIATGIVVLVMVEISLSVIDAVKDIKNPAALEAASKILNSVSMMFVIAAGVTIVAMGVGAIILGTYGIGAAAILAGLVIISGTVGKMIETSNTIIDHLDQMKGDPEKLKARADAFGSVIHSIAEIVNAVASIVKAIPTGTISTGSSVAVIIEKSTELINGFMDRTTKLVDLVMTKAAELPEEKVKSAEAFGSLIGSVSTMIGSIMGPYQNLMEESSHWYQTDDSDLIEFDGKLGRMQKFIDTITANLVGGNSVDGQQKKGLIPQIIEAMNGITIGVPILEKAGPMIGSVFGAISNLLSAIKPEDVKNFQKTTTSGGQTITEIDTNAMNAANARIGSVMTSLKDSVPGLIRDIIGTVNTLKIEDIKKAEAIGPILTGVVGIINAIGGSMKTQGAERSFEGSDEKANQKTFEKFTQIVTPDFEGIFKQLKEHLPTFIKSIVNLTNGINIGPEFKSKLDTVTKIFGVVSEMPKIIQAFSELSKKGGGQVENINAESFNLAAHMAVIAEFFNRIAVWDWQYSTYKAKAPLIEVINALNNIGKFITGSAISVKIIDDVVKIVKGIQDSTRSLIDISAIGGGEDFNSYKLSADFSQVVEFWADINKSGYFGTLNTAFSGMVGPITALSASAKVIPDIKPIGEKFSTMVSDIQKISSENVPKFQKLQEDANTMKEMITNGTMTDIINTFNEAVKTVNELDRILANGVDANIAGKMNTLASGLGLGARVKSTMKQGDIVININMDVSMDAESLEAAILKQPKSEIRMRLNRALDSDLGTRQRTVPSTALLEPRKYDKLPYTNDFDKTARVVEYAAPVTANADNSASLETPIRVTELP